jgi:uncharacterized protein (TIGR02145 family)
MAKFPTNPSPRNDGTCVDSDYGYLGTGTQYAINFCLGGNTAYLDAGDHYLVQNGWGNGIQVALVDAPVEGVDYSLSPKGDVGVTGKDGFFTCYRGNTATFTLGNFKLGSMSCDNVKYDRNIFLPEILNKTRAQHSDADVVALSRLLWTLDANTSTTSTITIDATRKSNMISNIAANSVVANTQISAANYASAYNGTAANYTSQLLDATAATNNLAATYAAIGNSVALGNGGGASCELNCIGKCVGELDTNCGQVCGAPATPVLVGLTAAAGNNKATLSWTALSYTSTTYQIERSVNGGGSYTQIVASQAVNTYVDAGCTNGTTCRYRVTPTICSSLVGSAVAMVNDVTPNIPTCPGTPTVTDNNGVIIYDTVWVDINSNNTLESGECWMKQNLATNKRPNGASLNNSFTGDYNFLCPPRRGATNTFVLSDQDCANVSTGTTSILGNIYTWSTAMDLANSACNNSAACTVNAPHRGLCPSGWHISTDTDWNNLENYLKTSGQTCNPAREGNWDCAGAGSAIKEVGSNTGTYMPFFLQNTDATNSSGLTIRAAGHYTASGWYDRGWTTYFWVASPQYSAAYAFDRIIASGNTTVHRGPMAKIEFSSVRCVQN